MKHSIQLPIAVLNAAILATKNSNTDCIEPVSETITITDSRIFGTNKHLIFYAKLDNVTEDITIVLPCNSVKAFLKKIKKFNLHLNAVCQLEYDTELKVGTLEVPNHMGAYEGFKIFHERNLLKNWRKLLPNVEKKAKVTDFSQYPQFQGQYIRLLEKIALLFGSVCLPVIHPTGEKTVAVIELKNSEVDYDLNVLLMPLDKYGETAKYAVAIYDEADDAEPSNVLRAETLDIAVRVVKRLRKEMSFGFKNINFAPQNLISIVEWKGLSDFQKAQMYPETAEEDHQDDKIFYTEDWFKLPLRRYDDADKAKEFMQALNEPVGCYVGDISTTADTIEDIAAFFLKHTKTPCLKN